MQQNAYILKSFSKMSIFSKFDFNKIELCVKLDIFKSYYMYIFKWNSMLIILKKIKWKNIRRIRHCYCQVPPLT